MKRKMRKIKVVRKAREKQEKEKKQKEKKYCGGMRVERGEKECKKKRKKVWFIIVEFRKVQLLKICNLISSRISKVY